MKKFEIHEKSDNTVEDSMFDTPLNVPVIVIPLKKEKNEWKRKEKKGSVLKKKNGE